MQSGVKVGRLEGSIVLNGKCWEGCGRDVVRELQFENHRPITHRTQWDMVAPWLVDSFQPDGRGFDSRSNRHVGTLGKSFTCSCLCASA